MLIFLILSCSKDNLPSKNQENKVNLPNAKTNINAGNIHNDVLQDVFLALQSHKDITYSKDSLSDYAYSKMVNSLSLKLSLNKSLIESFFTTNYSLNFKSQKNSISNYRDLQNNKIESITDIDLKKDLNLIINEVDNSLNFNDFKFKIDSLKLKYTSSNSSNKDYFISVCDIAINSYQYWISNG